MGNIKLVEKYDSSNQDIVIDVKYILEKSNSLIAILSIIFSDVAKLAGIIDNSSRIRIEFDSYKTLLSKGISLNSDYFDKNKSMMINSNDFQDPEYVMDVKLKSTSCTLRAVDTLKTVFKRFKQISDKNEIKIVLIASDFNIESYIDIYDLCSKYLKFITDVEVIIVGDEKIFSIALDSYLLHKNGFTNQGLSSSLISKLIR